MARRSYDQYCAVARALDLVGERWTLLLVRELVLGPRRYTDLLDGLPGVGTGMLAGRLRELEAHGLVQRRKLFPPATAVVYELTSAGRELEAVIDGLAEWGSRRLGTPRPSDEVRPRWVMYAMKTRFDAEAARGVRETYEFRLDRDAFHVLVDDGAVQVADGTARRPDLVVEGETAAFLDAALEPGTIPGAVEAGRLRVDGDLAALDRCRTIFAPALPTPAAEAA